MEVGVTQRLLPPPSLSTGPRWRWSLLGWNGDYGSGLCGRSVLVSGSVRGMRRILRVLESFCQFAGLRLWPNKCLRFLLDWCIVNHCQPWQLCGPLIHMIPPPKPETVCYLGVQVGTQITGNIQVGCTDQGVSSKATATTTATGMMKNIRFSLLFICGTRHIKTQSNFMLKAFKWWLLNNLMLLSAGHCGSFLQRGPQWSIKLFSPF